MLPSWFAGHRRAGPRRSGAAASPRGSRAPRRGCPWPGRRRSSRASRASPRFRSRRPSAGAWPGTSSPAAARAARGSCARRSMAASSAGASRADFARTCASSRSLKAGSTSRPNSSSDSQMCSWRFLPACRTKMTWSTPASSNRSRYARTCAGRPGRAAQARAVARRQLGPEPLLAQRRLDLGRVALIAAALEVLGPDVGRTGTVLAEDVVVPERVAEEVAALETPVERHLLVGMAHHLGDARDVGVDGQSDGDAALGQGLLVVRHPLRRLLGIDEGEGERADALLGRQQDGVAPRAGHPERRVRPLHRLGDDVARWHLHEAPVDPGERRLGHAAERDLESLEPGVPLGRRVDQEAAELGLRSGLARAELDPPARDAGRGWRRARPCGRDGCSRARSE